MNRLFLTTILTILTLTTFGQSFNPKDTSLADKQYFGALGTSLIGYNNDTRFYFSLYWQTGVEYNVTKSSKVGFAFSLLKFNWTRFQPQHSIYDNLNYFSASADIQIFGRRVFTRTKDVFNSYDKYLEYGIGYNCPYYFSIDKYIGNTKTSEKYPNTYNDIYLYSTFHFQKPLKIPLGIKLEYHPLDFIRNNDYPNMAKFRVDILISLFSSNDDRK